MKRILILFLFFFINLPHILAQCPACKTAIESNMKEGQTTGLGLNDGILYLLAAPYLLFGTVIFLWFRNKRKQQQEQSEA